MQYALEQFIDEAIQLELNAAAIYSIFSETIPEDANFWAMLAWEEKNHAAVLKTGKEILVPQDQFPLEVLPNFVQLLIETNNWLRSLIEEFSKARPDRATAFEIALKIEKSAGEQHFQRVMETPSDSKIINILQELCEDDLHHLRRVREYMAGTVSLPQQNNSEKGTKKILIVIDDASVTKLLETILEPEGQIDTASNGRGGLEKLKEKDYRLIISAIDMPVVDGISFYKSAKDFDRALNKKFLFFTGAPTSEHLAFFEKENLRYLTKPSTIDEIRSTAKDILADHQ